MLNYNEPAQYLIALPPEQAERLERAVASRTALDPNVDGRDVIVEAVTEHVTRLERRPGTRRNGRPERPGLLFQYLFGSDAERAFNRLFEGIIAVLDNAEALLDDAAILADAGRYERAEFLIATAQEEMGKAYILLDMCRIDLARRQDVLRHLCRSFYSHVLKHVYFDLSAHDYPGIRELPQVQYYFRVCAKEWWPSEPESGEPDMPHDTFFLREANLYVDVDSYAEEWMVPRLPSKALSFEMPFLGSPIDKAREALGRLRTTRETHGLFRPEALQIFNGAMKGVVVSERTSMDELRAAYERAGRDLEAGMRVPLHAFRRSALYSWPMYWVKR